MQSLGNVQGSLGQVGRGSGRTRSVPIPWESGNGIELGALGSHGDDPARRGEQEKGIQGKGIQEKGEQKRGIQGKGEQETLPWSLGKGWWMLGRAPGIPAEWPPDLWGRDRSRDLGAVSEPKPRPQGPSWGSAAPGRCSQNPRIREAGKDFPRASQGEAIPVILSPGF